MYEPPRKKPETLLPKESVDVPFLAQNTYLGRSDVVVFNLPNNLGHIRKCWPADGDDTGSKRIHNV